MTTSLTRDDLLKKKLDCDAQLAKLKAKLLIAKGDAQRDGKYLPPKEYAQLELDVKRLGSLSQRIQNEISSLKSRSVLFNDCFREAASRVIPENTMAVIIELAHDIKRQKELA